MFNVELPPDSSWTWSSGITTEDQNEIQRLESRIKVLEKLLQSWEINTNHITTKLSPSAQVTKDNARAALKVK